DLRRYRLVRQFERDLHFEILRTLAASVRQVHQDVRHVDKDGRLDLRCGGRGIAVAAEEEITAAADSTETDDACGHDQDEFERQSALGHGGVLRLLAFS